MSAEPYNFRKPGRLASDLEQRVAAWLRDACALAPEQWARHLPFRLEMTLQGMDTARPAEALGRLGDAVIGYRVALQQDGGLTLLVLPRPLALVFLTGMLGETVTELPADRDLTDVEESLGEYVVQHLLLAVMQQTWPGLQPLALALGQKEPHPKWARIFAPEDKVVVCTFVLRGPFGEQAWYWLVPQAGLLEQVARSEHGPEAGAPDGVRPRLENIVRELPVEVAVRLGRVELPLSLLARLREGDLIILDQRVSEPLRASVAGEEKFQGWPGRLGGRQAFQIASVEP